MTATQRTTPFLLLVVLSACGGATPGAETPAGDPLAPANLYPLAEGNVWSYDVDTGTELDTLAITRVQTRIGDRIEVSSGGDPVVYEMRDEGIFRPASSTWLLRAPVEPGAEWPSTQGLTARVVSVDESIETMGGTFDGCVRVQEDGGSDGREVRTVYCPGVGPVFLESIMVLGLSSRPARVTARLRGYQLAE